MPRRSVTVPGLQKIPDGRARAVVTLFAGKILINEVEVNGAFLLEAGQ